MEKDANEAFYTYYNFIDDPKSSTKHLTIATTEEFNVFIEEIEGESPEFIPKYESKPVLFDMLPNELIISCIKWACLLDINNFTSISLVSRKMLLLTRDTALWSFLCR